MTAADIPDDDGGGESCIASDLPRGVALLADLTTSLHRTQAALDTLTEKLKDARLCTAKGISILELKNQTLLSYLGNLVQVTLTKLRGNKLEGSDAIDLLVEYRAVLERLKPIEEKLKYQLEKHLKAAKEGAAAADDPLRLKGDLDNIGSSSSSEDEDEVQQGPGKKKKKEDGEDSDSGKLYKAPKISKIKYDQEEDGKDKAKERSQRRFLQSSMVKDFLEEHTEEPEVVHNADVLVQKAIKKRKEVEEYEETHMIRKQLTKKERAAQRQITTLGTMGSEIMGFSSSNPSRDPAGQPPTKKQKTSGKKGKKGFKKRRKH